MKNDDDAALFVAGFGIAFSAVFIAVFLLMNDIMMMMMYVLPFVRDKTTVTQYFGRTATVHMYLLSMYLGLIHWIYSNVIVPLFVK